MQLPLLVLLMMHRTHHGQPWRLYRCHPFSLLRLPNGSPPRLHHQLPSQCIDGRRLEGPQLHRPVQGVTRHNLRGPTHAFTAM